MHSSIQFVSRQSICSAHSITSWLYILSVPFGCCKIEFKMLFESTLALHYDSKQNMQVARCALMHIFWIKTILIAFWIEMDAYLVFICSNSNKQTKRTKWRLSRTKRIAHAANLQTTNSSDWIIKVIIGCVRVRARVRIALFVRNLNRSPGLNAPLKFVINICIQLSGNKNISAHSKRTDSKSSSAVNLL